MRKFWFSLAVFLGTAGLMLLSALLTGCQSPVSTGPTESGRYVVVNSKWEIVQSGDRSARSAEDIQAELDEYNAETLDDFLRLYYDTAPDISQAPLVSVYIVNPVTHAVNTVVEGVARTELVEKESAWRYDARGQILYIDHVPPAQPAPEAVTPYSYYAIYVVNELGGIEFEDHCGYLPDGSFAGEWILLDGGWPTIEAYFYQTQQKLHSWVAQNDGWRLILRQLYTEPQL